MAKNAKISELAHLMEFLQKMGYDVKDLSLHKAVEIKFEIFDLIEKHHILRDTDEVVEAFS